MRDDRGHRDRGGARWRLAIATSGRLKNNVAQMVARFPPTFDIWLFVWDGARFDEPEFGRCRIIHRDGYNKWDFAREFLNPEECSHLEVMLLWDDDLELSRFDPDRFVAIMQENRLEVAQPALTLDSYVSHEITRERPGVGRMTDFVEVMAPAWTAPAWTKWYQMLTPENPWGWGYDLAARSACGYERMGIIDCTPVRHIKPLTRLPEQFAGMRRFFSTNPTYRPCRGIVIGSLIDSLR
jgi:hypothetical protein